MLAQMSDKRGRLFLFGANKVRHCFLGNIYIYQSSSVLSWILQISIIPCEFDTILKCSICALQI